MSAFMIIALALPTDTDARLTLRLLVTCDLPATAPRSTAKRLQIPGHHASLLHRMRWATRICVAAGAACAAYLVRMRRGVNLEESPCSSGSVQHDDGCAHAAAVVCVYRIFVV